ncbi:MAG TPA: anti-sigma factor [Candidatus Competibacteraceae bacterium]|mgnify:CR=1 FL=1|nr:anti-sigma factor [Candidatus Competibacteraceae bacterium]
MKEPLSPELQDLHAYVDRQLPPHARQRVEAWLDANPAAKRQAEDYAAIREGLRALYDPALAEPIPQRLRRRPRRWLRPLGALAASLFLLLAGTWIGMQVERGVRAPLAGAPPVVREAAMAYAVYTPEVRHPVEVPGDQEPHLVAWLTKRLGAPVRAPRLDPLGFLLVGGRLLSSDDGPGALLMYENAAGRRVVLYACRQEEQEHATAFRFAQEEGVAFFYWVDGSLSYALAGEIGRADLLALAKSIYQQIAM